MSLGDIHRISIEMIEAAKEDRWDIVQEKEISRQKLLDDFFSSFHPEKILPEEETILQEIADMNSELLIRAESIKQEFISVVQQSLVSTKAVQKYQKHKNI